MENPLLIAWEMKGARRMDNNERKPIGRKSYGSIPHLPNSRLGPTDSCCSDGQARIACEKARDKHDEIFVQEKVDGSNVGIVRSGDEIIAITRAGYRAETSPYPQHHRFGEWVKSNESRFLAVLRDGERLCGEWMLVAHGTIYCLPHEPFVAFDLMNGAVRMPYDQFIERIQPGGFTTPHLLHRGGPCSIEEALGLLGVYGYHGATEPAEGCVWRVETNRLINKGERRRVVDYLVKYVRLDKVDGKYLMDGVDVYNTIEGANK
jgi:hypothetical protein